MASGYGSTNVEDWEVTRKSANWRAKEARMRDKAPEMAGLLEQVLDEEGWHLGGTLEAEIRRLLKEIQGEEEK